MRLFPVLLDLNEEEKIFGGIFSVRQVVYLLAGVIFTVLALLLPKALPLAARAAIGSPFAVAGAALSFVETRGVKLDKYIMLWIQYRLRRRLFFLRGDD